MERPFSLRFPNLMPDHHEIFRLSLFFVGAASVRVDTLVTPAKLVPSFTASLQVTSSKIVVKNAFISLLSEC